MQLMNENRERKNLEEKNHMDMEKYLLDKEFEKVDLNAARNMNSRNLALNCAIDNLAYQKLKNDELKKLDQFSKRNNSTGD